MAIGAHPTAAELSLLLRLLPRLFFFIPALLLARPIFAEEPVFPVEVPVGRSIVVALPDEIVTVSIADPRVADAAVGSTRTVVVNGKEAGRTTLVVYTLGGRYRVYDVTAFVPQRDRQVLLEVRVAEASRQAMTQLGFDWWAQARVGRPEHLLSGGLFTSKVTSQTPFFPPREAEFIPGAGPAFDGFASLVRTGDELKLAAVWQALEEEGNLRTLAHPNLVARSGEKAKFVAGGELPIPIVQSAGGGATTITVEWKEFGVRLEFVPTVWEDSTIQLQVAPEVSSLDFSTTLELSGFPLPALMTRKTSTTVLMKDGESLVLGGLTQKETVRRVRRVPVLGRIPLLGALFSHKETQNAEQDLLVVVTPRLLGKLNTVLPRLPGEP